MLLERKEVKDFIEKHHYSKSINGVMSSYCFGLFREKEMIGAMLYGNLGMANAWKKYAKKSEDVLELRRLVCLDDTLKNTESYFIGRTLRWLKQNTKIRVIVSYADPNHGHSGIIYRASNFKYLGTTSKGKMIYRLSDGKMYHDKAIRTKYKGKLKPFAQKLKEQLASKEAIYKKVAGKHIYIYKLLKN